MRKAYKGNIRIEAEDCYSPMKALLGERFLLNKNRGFGRGCGAGRDGFSVSAEGRLTPCGHLEIEEDFASLKEYWEKSEVLEKPRHVEDRMKSPCRGCQYEQNCIPCLAVGLKQKGEILMAQENCGPGRNSDAVKDKTKEGERGHE